MSRLIGNKGPRQSRSYRTWIFIGVALIAISLLAYYLFVRVARYAKPDVEVRDSNISIDATAPEEGVLFNGARLRHLGPIGLLNTYGSVLESGNQEGRLLATEISDTQRVLQQNIDATVSTGGLFGQLLHFTRLRWRWRTLDDGIPGQQLVETEGVVQGAAHSGVVLDYESRVRQSAVLDIGKAAPGSSGVGLWKIARAITFLTPMQNAREQRYLVARSLSLPGMADGGEVMRNNAVLHIAHPDDALAYASLGWAGLSGVISGVNAESIGVFLHFTKTNDVHISREAQPSPLIAQEVLENAHSLKEAIEIIQKAQCLGSAVYLVVDGNKRSWAKIERSPSRVSVERGSKANAWVDILESNTFANDPINERNQRARPALQRLLRARNVVKQSTTGTEQAVQMLRDRKSLSGGALVLGHRLSVDDIESVQAALFDVSGLAIWVSESGDSSGTFRGIDLRHELLGTAVAAPPEDISGENDTQGAREGIRSARKELILARKAKERNSLGTAASHAAKALSKAPSLPEALLVAGQIAVERGDELSARAFFRGYLALGADDLKAKEQIQAWLGTL